MKIEIEVEDLSKFIDAYNHAYNVFISRVRSSILLGVEEDNVSPDLLKALKNKSNKLYGNDTYESLLHTIDSECTALKNIYDQLIKLEKEKQNES